MNVDGVEKVNNPVRVGPIGIGGKIGPLHLDECYQRADWKIKKAPWNATDLPLEVFRQVRQRRKLPAALKSAPVWA